MKTSCFLKAFLKFQEVLVTAVAVSSNFNTLQSDNLQPAINTKYLNSGTCSVEIIIEKALEIIFQNQK